jgi:RHH-type proline utilization regulon transcriptional repressor/proline dehydrogenase/delta 1-pyrroline-5-carboxylate dehydrogenase
VFQEKWETDACYERAIELLVDRAGVLRPAFASHNVRSLARASPSRAPRSCRSVFRREFRALYGAGRIR